MSQSRSIHRLLGFTFALALLASAGCPVNSDATFTELADFTQAEIARQKVPGAAIAVVGAEHAHERFRRADGLAGRVGAG